MKREYSGTISLVKNTRGVSSLDTTVGCSSGMALGTGGCYGECYAAKSGKLYGYDFSKTITRRFMDRAHILQIRRQVESIDLDFVRIGTNGDPSENWPHTMSVIDEIKNCQKVIVIITKHWQNLTDEMCECLGGLNVVVNTSTSALDPPNLRHNALKQYSRLKIYLKSILRVVTANFNTDNEEGRKYDLIQQQLLKNDNVLDTVLRISPNNRYFTAGIISADKKTFLGADRLVSKHNNKTFMSVCQKCPEMCGLLIDEKNRLHKEKRGIKKQIELL